MEGESGSLNWDLEDGSGLDTWKGGGEIFQARETGLQRLGRRTELVSDSKEKSRVVGERLTRQGRTSLWKA